MAEEKKILIGEYDGTEEDYERFKFERLGQHCATAQDQRNDIIRSIEEMSANGEFYELETIGCFLRRYCQQMNVPGQQDEVWTMIRIIRNMLMLKPKDLSTLSFFASRWSMSKEEREQVVEAERRWANQHKEAKEA